MLYIFFSLLVTLHSNKSERNKTVLSVIEQWNSLRLLHHIKLWVKDEGKTIFPRVDEKLSGNSTAAKDIKSADKEFEMNSD